MHNNKHTTKPPFPDFPFDDTFAVIGNPQNMSYNVNVDDEFTHPKQFEEIVAVLEQASEGDYMRINLTTNGGALHSILPLLGAMQHTDCHVHVHACSDVASAGTFLLMKADSVSINDYVTIMCHEVSFGSAGSGHTVARHVDHTLKSSEKLIRDMYEHFFTEEELDKMLSGSDYYMDKDEFLVRYNRRFELQKAADDIKGDIGDEEAFIEAVQHIAPNFDEDVKVFEQSEKLSLGHTGTSDALLMNSPELLKKRKTKLAQ